LQKEFSLDQEKHHDHHQQQQQPQQHKQKQQEQQQAYKPKQQINGSSQRSNESTYLSNITDKMSPLKTNGVILDTSTNVIHKDTSNGDNWLTDKVTTAQSPAKVVKSDLHTVAKSFHENDKSTNCPSEKSELSSQMSYETTYPVFSGQTEYGQEGIHVEPFYRYRVYSESKV
jgi:hypothetical protein